MKTFKDYLESAQIDHEFDGWTREKLMRLCVQNDRNGVWTDEDNKDEGNEPVTRDEFIKIIRGWMTDYGYKSFHEFRRALTDSQSRR